MQDSRRKVRTATALMVIVLLVGLGWRQMQDFRSHGPGADGEAEVGLTLYLGEDGIPLPQVAGKTVDGQMLDLAELRGHVVVLNVWGSWCAPCRAEAPDLAAISSETQSRGVRFVGIDVRDNPAAARAFASKYEITYPSLDDQNGLILAQFTGIIPVSAVPSTLVVDKFGVIRGRVVGRITRSTLLGLVEDVEKTK